ncbi:MAG: amino acid ABC transporter permease [Hyphomicrobiales bacterium]
MVAAAETRERPKVSFWNDPKVRSIFVQAGLAILLGLFAYEIAQNTVINLRSRNIASGFEFLRKTAGFDIIQSLIPFSSAANFATALLVGLINTVLVSALAIVAATIIGFIMGVMRLSTNWLLAKLATIYIEIFRNVPILLWIFVWYAAVLQPLPGPRQSLQLGGLFFLSNRGLMMPRPVFGEGAWLGLAGLIGGIVAALLLAHWARRRQERTGEPFPVFSASLALIVLLPFLGLALAGFPLTIDIPELKGFNFAGGVTVIPEFIALFLALSIYTGTYIAEAVRAGIQSVSKGQSEAAHALGLHPGQALRLVVIPQAMRVVIPPLASTYLSLTKNSSLAVAIGYPDLVAVGGTVLNQTGQAIEIVSVWMIVYLSLSLITSGFMNWFNARMRLVER